MMKVKRFLSAMLVCVMMFTLFCIPTTFAAEQIDQSVTYNFDANTSVPAIFSRTGGGGTVKIESGALKVTTDAGKTETFKIDISDWAGASRKKGVLTYSFDYKPELDGPTTSIMVGSSSTSAGHILAALRKTMLIGYSGAQSQAANEWLGINDTNSPHRVTLTFDFSQKIYSCSVGGKTVSHPFNYFANKTSNDQTYNCENADKFVLYLRTYYADAYSYYIDNFKAEYTERYIQENVTRCVNFVNVINNNGTTEEFKNALLDIAPLVGSYGDYNTQKVADDSMAAIAELQKVLYDNAPFDTSADKLDTVIPEIMDIVKNNMHMISINFANTATEMAYSLASYNDEYSIDISFVDGYEKEEKQSFYSSILNYRNNNGKFLSNDDIATAISEAKFTADCYKAFEKYKTAHALTLPSVFNEYKSVLEVDMSYIEEENRNQTLFILKTMTLNSYLEVPSALRIAYEKAKNNKETFAVAYEYDVDQEFGPKTDWSTTVLPKEPYFVDMSGFDWAHEAVEYLFEKDIVSGKADRCFAPNDKVTREEFVKMIVGAFDIELSDKGTGLKDIDENEWYVPYVNAVCDCGIVQGHSDGNFGVGEYITREDVAVILYRTANVKNIQLEVKVGDKFKDIDEISEYAQNPVGVLRYNKIINGVGESIFGPKLNTTRAEAAVMIYKLLNI